MVRIASAGNDVTGKWLLFPSKSAADAIWYRIAVATVKGELGCSAKISPSKDQDDSYNPVLCVYVEDFRVKSEVKRVLEKLIAMKLTVVGFKLDFYTSLQIDSKNEWNLKPCFYTVDEALSWTL